MFSTLSSTTTSAVIGILKTWCNLLGWPQSICLDGGPQFRGEFVKFCKDNRICHELSAPYNPRSDGLAEFGIKMVKSILINFLGEGKDVQRALYEWRNVYISRLLSSSADVRPEPEYLASSACQRVCTN